MVLILSRCLLCTQADELINLGFKDQIYDIYRYLPPNTQVCLISATMTQEVLEMTTKFMTDPIRILVKRDELTLEGIKQVQPLAPLASCCMFTTRVVFRFSGARRLEIRHALRTVRIPLPIPTHINTSASFQ